MIYSEFIRLLLPRDARTPTVAIRPEEVRHRSRIVQATDGPMRVRLGGPRERQREVRDDGRETMTDAEGAESTEAAVGEGGVQKADRQHETDNLRNAYRLN